MSNETVRSVEDDLMDSFLQLSKIQAQIREKLQVYADGKKLKGNELVGWLGEIYGKLLLNGILVDDRYEHDIETPEGWKVSVKARKGTGSGWHQTSAIPKIDGDDCPTHILFVHLSDNYSLDKMWLFEWEYLKTNGRFRKHNVRGNLRSYIFILNDTTDQRFIVYNSNHR